MGCHTRKHFYGDGIITDSIKSIGRKLFSGTAKDVAKTASKKPCQQQQVKQVSMLVTSRRQNNQAVAKKKKKKKEMKWKPH